MDLMRQHGILGIWDAELGFVPVMAGGALGTDPFDTTTLATWIPEVWLDELRAFRERNLVAANLVKRVPFEGSVGDTIHVPDLTRLAINDVTEGSAVTLDNNTETEFTGTITRWRAGAFQVPDRVARQAKFMVTSAYTQSGGKSIAEDLDQHIWNLESGFNGGTRKQGDGTDYSAGTGVDFSDAGLRTLLRDLMVVDVPLDARALLAHPRQWSVLLGIDRFVEFQSVGPGGMPIRTGLFGEIYGVPVFFSTNGPANVASADVNLLLQMDAIVLAMQMDVRIQSQYHVDFLSWLTVVDYLGQAFEFRDDHAFSVVTPQ